MHELSRADISTYHDKGFVILRGFLAGTDVLAGVAEEVHDLGRVFDPEFEMASAAEHIRGFSPEARKAFYGVLRYLRSLNRLASSSELAETSRKLGLRLPAIMNASNLRMDMPDEAQHLFHWHQDIAYLLGSLNSLTYWVPLGATDSHHGSITVIPGSHRDGFAPVRYTRDDEPSATRSMSPKDLVLRAPPVADGEMITAAAGDLVVFSQFLLHKSTYNHSDKVRWTAQIRHSDIAEPEFISAGYPFGDVTNIFHNRYLSADGGR